LLRTGLEIATEQLVHTHYAFSTSPHMVVLAKMWWLLFRWEGKHTRRIYRTGIWAVSTLSLLTGIPASLHSDCL